MQVGAGCVAEQKQHTKNIAKKILCMWMDCSTWAESAFEGWCLSEGQWESWLKSACCKRMDAAVRTRHLQVHRVNVLPRHGASSLVKAVSKLAVP